MKRYERAEALELMAWVERNTRKYPKLKKLYHIPNGGFRHPKVARELKEEGVKAGVPDYCLPVKRGHYSGLYIELKAKKNSKLGPDQKKWIEWIVEEDFAAGVCYGADEAIKILEAYLRD